MKEYILLHNDFYPKSAFILTENLKKLCQKLQVPIAGIQKIACENRLLPFVDELKYYGQILRALVEAQKKESKLLVYDSQTLLGILEFFRKYYEDLEFKEQLLKDCTEEIATFTKVYGKLFKSFMDEGFTNNQAFRLVEIYAQNMLEAALW